MESQRRSSFVNRDSILLNQCVFSMKQVLELEKHISPEELAAIDRRIEEYFNNDAVFKALDSKSDEELMALADKLAGEMDDDFEAKLEQKIAAAQKAKSSKEPESN